MRDPGIFNIATLLGFLIGPAIGTFSAAYVADYFWPGSGNDRGAAFAFTVMIGGIYSYGATLFLLAPITLALRHRYRDYLWLFPLIGYVIGIILFIVVVSGVAGLLHVPIALFKPKATIMISGPLAATMLAIRLIAGRRT